MEQAAMEALRGVILSDGSLVPHGQNAYFSIGLSDNRSNLVQREQIPIEDLLLFLQHLVMVALKPLGIKPCRRHPRTRLYKNPKTDEKLPGVVLETTVSELLTELYPEYYPAGKKVVPEGSILTDILLAYFFMLDGYSAWHNRGGPTIKVYLYTQGFDLHSVEILENQLLSLGVNTGRAHVGGGESKVVITVSQESVDHFMSIVDPYVVPPYRYKIKYRESRSPELVDKCKEHQGEQGTLGLLVKINSIRSMIG